ncbi:MAG: hypothetical protein QOD67_3146, partial [Caballeronia sp.]|nr:hypothetical protein [Caballeronia sp.]
ARAQNRNIGSDFNDFRAEEGILDEVTAATEQRVREWQHTDADLRLGLTFS